MRFRSTVKPLVLSLLCMFAMNASAAGRVMFVKGEVHLERGQRTLPLTKGLRVEAGDLIVTGEEGRVQLIMEDGDRMALQPNTRFRIDAFTAPSSAAQPDTGIAFYSLLRGGFRAITRSLGMRSDSSYKVTTPVATIGIRGTHYNARFCENDCGGAQNGLYTGVVNGAIILTNDGGKQVLGKNQYAHVFGQGIQPQLLLIKPSVLNDSPEGEGSGDGTVGDSYSNRSSPAEGEMDPPPGTVYTPEQTIQGTDPFGGAVDLTPGHQPPPRQGPTSP